METVEAAVGRLLTATEREVWPGGELRAGFVVSGGHVLTAWHCVRDIGGTAARAWLRLQPLNPDEQYVDVPVRYVDHAVDLDAAVLTFDGSTVADAERLRVVLDRVALPLGTEVRAHDPVRVGGFPQRNPAVYPTLLNGVVASADALIGRTSAVRVHVNALAARHAEQPAGLSGGPLLRQLPDLTEEVVGVVSAFPAAVDGRGAIGGWVLCRRMADLADRFPALDDVLRRDGSADSANGGGDDGKTARPHLEVAEHGKLGSNHPAQPRPRMLPRLAAGMIDRPRLAAALMAALDDTQTDGTVVVTAVHGAGGFGKSTLVKQVCHEPRIHDLFFGAMLWTELGQEANGVDLATKINDLTEQLCGVRPTLSDPQQAGFQLGAILDSIAEPVLLVVDDVWRDEQVQPFLVGGRACRRIVTTRYKLPSLSDATEIQVDVMAAVEAQAVLVRDLDPLPPNILVDLLRLTGQWPLLLDITNRTIIRYASGRLHVEAAAMVVDQLRTAGPTGLDDAWLSGNDQRQRMVAACINASLDNLPPQTRARYLELAIFAEDSDITYPNLELVWSCTAGLNSFEVEQLGRNLIEASLATPAHAQPGLRVHDVVRLHLRAVVGTTQLVDNNRTLIDAAAADLDQPSGVVRPWWTLPRRYDYLWKHLIDHLADAGLHAEVDHLVIDLRWISARIRRSGPDQAEADLARSEHPTASILGTALRHNAHLLTPVDPEHAIDDILASRLDGHPTLQPQLAAFTAALKHRPRLANRWPPPDQPHPTLRRTIRTDHPYGVGQIHLAPDSTWLATVGSRHDPVLRIFDKATGQLRQTIETGHPHGIAQVLLAPDGAWLATAGVADSPAGHNPDPTLRIFDPTTGQPLHIINTSHPHGIAQINAASDGTWLATVGVNGATVFFGLGPSDDLLRIFNPATGQPLATLSTCYSRGIRQVHVAPDGTWLATVGDNAFSEPDSVLRIFDTVTRRLRHTIETGHPYGIAQVLLAPDGAWLATAGVAGSPAGRNPDATVRIIDPATGQPLHTIETGHPQGIAQIRAAPDGTWLATAGLAGESGPLSSRRRIPDPMLRTFDPVTGQPLHTIDTGHPHGIAQIHAAPDGTWLATIGTAGDLDVGPSDRILRIFNPMTGQRLATVDTGYSRGIGQMHIGPDGTWLATVGYLDLGGRGGHDPVLRIFHSTTGQHLHTIDTGHPDGIGQIGLARDGTWLATVDATTSHGSVVKIFDSPGGQPPEASDTDLRHALGQIHLAPDGTWLAAVGADAYGGRDNVLRLFDSATGHLLRVIYTGHPHGIGRVRLAPDGTWLATIGCLSLPRNRGRDPVLKTFDAATGQPLHAIDTGHPDGIGQIGLAPDGIWLATIGGNNWPGSRTPDQVLRIFDAATGQLLHAIDTGHPYGIGQVHVAPDSTWLATIGAAVFFGVSKDPVLRIFDPTTGQALLSIDTGHHGIGQILVAPDGTWLATMGDTDSRERQDAVLRIFDSTTGQLLQAINTGHPHGIRQMHVSHDGMWLATVGGSRTDSRIPQDAVLRIFDSTTGQPLRTIETGHAYGIRQVCVAPDGTWLATIGAAAFRNRRHDGVVKVFDTATGRPLHSIDVGHSRGIREILLSHDGTWLAAVSTSAITVWCGQNQSTAAMRIDGAAGQSLVLRSSDAILIAGSRGLYGLDVVRS